MTAVSRQEKNVPPRFFGLPAELRNRIYRHVMVSDETIEVQTKFIGPRRYCLAIVPALTQVSKQLRSETQRLFILENRFRIKLEPMQGRDIRALRAFSHMHSHAGLHLRSLQVSYEVYKRCDGVLWLLRADLTFCRVGGCVEITEQAYTKSYRGSGNPHAHVCDCAVKRLLRKHNASAKSHDLVRFLEDFKYQQRWGRRSYNDRDIHRLDGPIFSADICPDCSGTALGSRCFLF